MRRWWMLGPVVPVLLVTIVNDAPAQVAESEPSDRVQVFLDCQTRGCAFRDFRTEITYVDWVRERTAADVHIIMTSQELSAGREYVLDFIGSGDLAGVEESLTHSVPDTETEDARVRALTRVLSAGLVRYVARRGQADQLEIGTTDNGAESEAEPAVQAQQDPWNYWVFEVGLDTDMEGEERQTERRFDAYVDANRTTAQWKVDIRLGGNFQRESVQLSEDSVFHDNRDDWNFSTLLVRSVGDHWSTGMQLGAHSSTEENRDLGSRSAVALEWNLFPYEEANRRQLIVHYQLGYAHVRYDELTIFEKMQENLSDQRLSAVYSTRQTWGDASAGVTFSHYLHDVSKNRLSFDGNVSVQIFRGLELNLRGDYGIIRDQLFLPAEELTPEEILSQRRALATGYEYELGVGISYRFGSIFNNVVNNRFPWDVRP